MAVYNAMKGMPITAENAQQIYLTVLKLSGVPYTDSFVLYAPVVEELPTMPVKKISK